MPHLLGIDIGSNSVGSAWIDTHARQVHLAASVFPAGVEEREDKRGAPKNQKRRQSRSQRRTIARRAKRKRALVRFLIQHGLLPASRPGNDRNEALDPLLQTNPWHLRRNALSQPLTPHEFGRVVLHLAQRRGAVGIVTDPDDPEEGRKVKEGMDRLSALMKKRNAQTVGQLLGDLMDERGGENGAVRSSEPVRNRQYRTPADRLLFAGRELIRKEFRAIVQRQRSFPNSRLADLLTDDLVRQLDDPTQTSTWRHQGLLFGQRRTYWDTGTLGRCDLEPSDRCCPHADRHAGYFRVVETVNNIRIEQRGQPSRPLTPDERDRLIRFLRRPLGQRKQKGKMIPKTSASVSDIRRALGIRPADRSVSLNIEKDTEREINTDWFHREIVHGAFTEERWDAMSEAQKESVNRAILKFDPDHEDDASKLRAGAIAWWGLAVDAADRLIAAWNARPKLEKRLNLSRRAILNLLPYMERFDQQNNRWPTQIEARKAYAADPRARDAVTGQPPDERTRERYRTGALGLRARDRYYMRQQKHEIAPGIPALPPAPMLSNPVVRKAIHEVRRHLMAWIRKFGRKPDRVVIELARITKQSGVVRNDQLKLSGTRNRIRSEIIKEFNLAPLSLNQQRAAVDRVILARQQTQICPYCGQAGLTDRIAATGRGLETDHIIPKSRTDEDGLANRVLVHVNCNRGKGNLTPKEWLDDNEFRNLEQRLKDFKKASNALRAKKTKEEKRKLARRPGPYKYFTIGQYARKWHNFDRKAPTVDEFRKSQLTDTAYAARQVAAYLADALFDGRGLPERGDGQDQQRIFFTVGKLTLMLRKDWQLFETLKPPRGSDGRYGDLTAEDELTMAAKNRGDHREHAIDAATIALTDPKIKNTVASWAAQAAEYHEKHHQWPRRTPVPPPWGDVPSFRRQVLSQVYDRFDSGEFASGQRDEHGKSKLLIVSHRPVKRRLGGAFHEETHFGPVLRPLASHRNGAADTLFTNRIPVYETPQKCLAPNHLRVPDGWDKLSARLDEPTLPPAEKRAVRRQLGAMKDPSPGKSGIVRDRALRDRLRKCLRANELDPDDFKPAEIKKLVDERRVTMASGVPIKGVVLLRTITDPVVIPRKKWDPLTDRMVIDSDPRTVRVYIGGNNHHIEIRERTRKRKGRLVTEWHGEIITTFEAAKRVRVEKRDAVNRSDNDQGRFVTSLAEGEMIYARRWDPKQKQGVGDPDYFVLCKLDKLGTSSRIHFAPHWDARKASEQHRWSASPADLKDCGPQPGQPPCKVHVSPLGEVRRLERD